MVDRRRAELYAHLHTGNSGDSEHYARVCRGARSVLELGSGAGRISLALAAQGLEVTGLECDEASLELAREAGAGRTELAQVTWVRADMRQFDLGRTFERILLPYNGLYCLGGVDGALACFQRVAAHLAPDGEFWLDVYEIDAFHDEAPDDPDPDDSTGVEEDDPVARLAVGGEALDVYEATRWTREEQRLDVCYRFLCEGREVARETLTHHYLLGSQVALLMEEAGLEVGVAYGGFAGESLEEDSDFLVLGARRAC